jgi:hypothetical protein
MQDDDGRNTFGSTVEFQETVIGGFRRRSSPIPQAAASAFGANILEGRSQTGLRTPPLDPHLPRPVSCTARCDGPVVTVEQDSVRLELGNQRPLADLQRRLALLPKRPLHRLERHGHRQLDDPPAIR